MAGFARNDNKNFMNNQEKIAVDPQIKKEINEEGFEENAAVLVGKKEEMPQMLERLEKEGMAENLATYIKMHKELALPNREINESLLKEMEQNRGLCWLERDDFLYYIDSDLNIARVKIDALKISSIKSVAIEGESINWNKYRSQLNKEYDELKKLGFKFVSFMDRFPISIQLCIRDYNKKIDKELEERTDQEFDF